MIYISINILSTLVAAPFSPVWAGKGSAMSENDST